MVDVLDVIKGFLLFESDDDFYYLQIIQRKKENSGIGSNSRIIKNYYIGSISYLESKYDEIKDICKLFNARAMLRLNKRSYKKVALRSMVNIANSISNNDYSHIKKSYDRACGVCHNDNNKSWILDFDEYEDINNKTEVIEFIDSLEPFGNKVLIELPTKSGIHLITKPFNLSVFSVKYPSISVHKDNPINLYIP